MGRELEGVIVSVKELSQYCCVYGSLTYYWLNSYITININ